MWLFMVGADPQSPIYKLSWIGDDIIEAPLWDIVITVSTQAAMTQVLHGVGCSGTCSAYWLTNN